MSWRLANSLVKLRDQVNAVYPNRSKASDGTIGDAAHAASVSDHNPDGAGVVAAFDITHDPAHGLDIWALANQLTGDSRVKYLIANGKIFIDGRWQNYTGSNPHTSHLHVSVKSSNYDNATPWQIGVSVFNGKTAEQWYKDWEGEHKINVIREDYLNRIAYAAGDDLDPVEGDDVDRIIAKIDQKNKELESLKKQLGTVATDLLPGLYRVK